MKLEFKVYWDQCNLVPRCIHINMSRMTETLVARFIGKLVCWDQVKQLNGRIGIKQYGNMGELVYGSDGYQVNSLAIAHAGFRGDWIKNGPLYMIKMMGFDSGFMT